MAATDRKFGWDVTVLSLEGNSLIAVYADCKLSQNFTNEIARATRDTVAAPTGTGGWNYNKKKERGATLTLGAVVDSTLSASHLIKLAITGGQLTIFVTRPGGSGATACYTGEAIFTEADIDFPDAAALQGATLELVGPLSTAAAPS